MTLSLQETYPEVATLIDLYCRANKFDDAMSFGTVVTEEQYFTGMAGKPSAGA